MEPPPGWDVEPTVSCDVEVRVAVDAGRGALSQFPKAGQPLTLNPGCRELWPRQMSHSIMYEKRVQNLADGNQTKEFELAVQPQQFLDVLEGSNSLGTLRAEQTTLFDPKPHLVHRSTGFYGLSCFADELLEMLGKVIFTEGYNLHEVYYENQVNSSTSSGWTVEDWVKDQIYENMVSNGERDQLSKLWGRGIDIRLPKMVSRNYTEINETDCVNAEYTNENAPWRSFQVLAAKKLPGGALSIVENLANIDFFAPPEFDTLVIVPHFMDL